MEEKKRSRGWCGWFMVLIVLAAVACGIYLAVRHTRGNSGSDAEPVPGPPGAVTKKYADALKIAMQFFDVQKSGKLKDNPISWRGDSALNDGDDASLDLSKGMYDAGDHMKFGFPMAYTATVLSWAILEYGDQMQVVNQLQPARDSLKWITDYLVNALQLQPARDSLKWITDYLVNAHPTENVLYIQVGDPDTDHGCWNKPEDMKERRPLIQINTTVPGTEVAAETAAAMAAASLVFKDDSTYSSLLLRHAKQLFTFADKYRESYSVSIPEVQTYYNSTGYGDELLWAASWLYHATGEKSYFDYVTGENGQEFANWGSPTWFSWDNKLAGTQVLLSRVSFFGANGVSNSSILQKYRASAEAVMCGLLPRSPTLTSSRTHNGLIWVSEWNALQHPVASAFLATVYSDYMLTSQTARLSCNGNSFRPSDLRKFAMSQADYVLGNNPMKLSYLVGYGDKYPQFVHHRGASIPADQNPSCKDGFEWLDSDRPNPNVAMGALVGGPFRNESYVDSRNNSMQAEPSTYNSAVLVGLLSSLVTTSSVAHSLA